jgi:hypothetical protein
MIWEKKKNYCRCVISLGEILQRPLNSQQDLEEVETMLNNHLSTLAKKLPYLADVQLQVRGVSEMPKDIRTINIYVESSLQIDLSFFPHIKFGKQDQQKDGQSTIRV